MEECIKCKESKDLLDFDPNGGLNTTLAVLNPPFCFTHLHFY